MKYDECLLKEEALLLFLSKSGGGGAGGKMPPWPLGGSDGPVPTSNGAIRLPRGLMIPFKSDALLPLLCNEERKPSYNGVKNYMNLQFEI